MFRDVQGNGQGGELSKQRNKKTTKQENNNKQTKPHNYDHPIFQPLEKEVPC